MPVTYFPLLVDVSQVVGTPVKRARLQVKTNLPDGVPLAYGPHNQVLTPGGIYDLPDGRGTINLPTRDGATNVSAWQYVITGEYYVDGARPVQLDPVYITAPLAENAAASINFAWHTSNSSAPPTFIGEAVAQITAAGQSALASTQVARNEAHAARDGAVTNRELAGVYRNQAQAAAGTAAADAAAGVAAATAADRAKVQADRAFVEARTVDDLSTTDGQTKALIETPSSETAQALAATVARATDPLAWLKAKRTYTPFLSKWEAAVAGVRAGTRDARILCVGDSTTHGVGGGATDFYERNAYPARLVDIFNDRFIPAANGFAAPKPGGTSYPDNRWTLGAGWFDGGAGVNFRRFGVPGRIAGANTVSVTTPLTFNDPRVLADTFDIYYVRQRRSGTLATFIAQATGGTAVETSISGNGHPEWQLEPEIRKVTVTAATAATTNVVTIAVGVAVASQLLILGIEPRLSTAKRVIVGNAGSGGTTSQSWVDIPSDDQVNNYGVGGPRMIRALAPDLTVIDLGINDGGTTQTPPATFAANIAQLVAAGKASGDVLIKTPVPSQARDMSAYLAALRAIDAPLWDGYAFYGSWEQMNAQGFMADTLHPSAAGYVDVATRLYQVLANAPA